MYNLSKDIYVDAAASSIKPQSVIDIQMDFLANRYANAGRGICTRVGDVDKMVNNARMCVAKFINAEPHQVVFTSGTTDGLNRIVHILGVSKAFAKNPVVMVSDLDHHSARLPWEEMAYLGQCEVKVMALDENFNIDTSKIERADIMVITAMSNVFGVPQDVKKIIAAARAKNPNVITIVDAAQYVVHAPIDVVDWDADFVCFSGHKIGADTGIGIMYIKQPDRWQVDKLGGGMVIKVSKDDTEGATSKWTLASVPAKFEAGTLPLTQIAGLVPAIDELGKTRGDNGLIKYLYDELSKIDRIKIITSRDASLLTFVVDSMSVLDFGALMGASNICLRVGNMCATWIHKLIGQDGTIRISTGPWNTMDEMNTIITTIKKILSK